MTADKTPSIPLTRRVMVVDDDEVALYFTTELLRHKGYEVIACQSALESLKSAEAFHPDVILSDLVMPDMDGITLMGQIKKKLPDAEVIIITGQADIDSAIKSLREGAVDFLVKPVAPEEIIAALNRSFEKYYAQKAASGGSHMRSVIRGALESVEMERTKMLESANMKLQKIIFPQIEQMEKTTDDENIKEGLTFIKELLDSIFSSSSAFPDNYSSLTPIETQICAYLMRGKSSQEIADALNRSLDTIYDHQKKIRNQLGLTNTRQSLGTFLRKQRRNANDADSLH